MTGEYDPKEFTEEMERAFKNFLEDLKPEAAENLITVEIEPGHINYTYILDDGIERSDRFQYSPYDYYTDNYVSEMT